MKHTAELIRYGVPTRNGTVYNEGCFRGHLGQVQLGHIDTPRTPVPVIHGEVSHMATLRQEGGAVVADIETLNTPHGRLLASLLADGVKVQFLPRGQGKVSWGGDVSDFRLFSVDAVADPGRLRARREEVIPPEEGGLK